jgi:hypothetical protein
MITNPATNTPYTFRDLKLGASIVVKGVRLLIEEFDQFTDNYVKRVEEESKKIKQVRLWENKKKQVKLCLTKVDPSRKFSEEERQEIIKHVLSKSKRCV